MPTIKVTVMRVGRPVRNARVVLSFYGVAGGMSSPVLTDSAGIAEFDVGDSRSGRVYVDGMDRARWGSSTVCDITVSI